MVRWLIALAVVVVSLALTVPLAAAKPPPVNGASRFAPRTNPSPSGTFWQSDGTFWQADGTFWQAS